MTLLGKRIVSTGNVDTETSLTEQLTSHGAVVMHYPCIEIDPLSDPSSLDSALRSAGNGQFTWLAYTSSNAVEQVAHRLRAANLHPPRAKCAVIGSSTATRVREELGISIDFVPTTFTSTALADQLPITVGETVLIPQADIAAPTLADGLRDRGASVTTVTAYNTITGSGGIDLPALLKLREVDAILFASPSAVSGCLERLVQDGGHPDLLAFVPQVCIGPVTADAASTNGLINLVIAPEHTRHGMVDALIALFSTHRKEHHV